MLEVLKIVDGIVYPDDKILMIEPFSSIWNRDKSKNKEVALKDFKYIEFMVSPFNNNPYKDLVKEDRSKRIKEEVLLDVNYKEDKLVLSAIDLYEKWLKEYSISYKFLISAKKAANEVIEFLNNVDLNERTKSGTPVYKPSDITKALSDINSALKNINELEKNVFEEIKIRTTRGNKELNPLEL